MSLRLGAIAGVAAPVSAAAAIIKKGDAVTGPVVWHLLGYPFEAGSMIAALCACVAVRFYVVQHGAGANRWLLDIPVSALAFMFTAGIIVTARPAPLTALLFGTGVGALGAGIIKLAKGYVDRWLGDTAGTPRT